MLASPSRLRVPRAWLPAADGGSLHAPPGSCPPPGRGAGRWRIVLLHLLPGQAATAVGVALGDILELAGAAAEVLVLLVASVDDGRRLDDAHGGFLAAHGRGHGDRLVG